MAVLHFCMAHWFETVTDLDESREILRQHCHGVIDVREGRLRAINLRPWPKLISLAGVAWGHFSHCYIPGNRMRLYYDQPRNYPNFLALKFAISSRDTTLKTALLALKLLDKIAEIKQSDALLMDATNFRLSSRMLARFGWKPHAPSRWHRNYIKRLYLEAKMEERESMTVAEASSSTPSFISFSHSALLSSSELRP